MTIADNMKPLSLGPGVEFTRSRFGVTAPGTSTFSAILACDTFWGNAMVNPCFATDAQIEFASEAGLFDALLKVESVDRDNHRAEVRVLRLYEAPRVPEAELMAGGLCVRWIGGATKWAVVTAEADPEVDPVVRGSFRTERSAANALAALTGGKKRRQST